MIYLTDKLAVTADSECYMVGRPVETAKESGGKRCKAPKLRSPRYYSTLAGAVRGAVSTTLRQKVAASEITSCKSSSARRRPCRSILQNCWNPWNIDFWKARL